LKELPTTSAHYRQIKVAKKYLEDAFPQNGASNFISTAYGAKSLPSSQSPAFEWMLQLQGPLLVPPQLEDDYTQTSAKSIVPFTGGGDLVGFAIGYSNETIDVSVASPSVLVPRFQLELQEDTKELDECAVIGATINRIDLSNEENDGDGNVQLLIPDPILETVLHVVTPSHVISISTNAARVVSNKVREEAKDISTGTTATQNIFSPPSRRGDLQPKTTAWTCLDVSYFQGKQNPVVGAMVSGNVQFGHCMISRLANGKMIALNLTETRHLHEMENYPGNAPVVHSTVSDVEKETMQYLHETKPLVEIVQPLVEKMNLGLSKMRQFVGSATSQEGITLNVMAGVIATTEQCQKNVYLPLVEMNEYVSSRRAELKEMCKKQKDALKAIQKLVGMLREKQSAVQEKTEILKENGKSLVERSASVLQSSSDLIPKITEAEYQYFQELKKVDSKTSTWKSQIDILNVKAANICESIENGTASVPLRLSEEELDHAKKLQKMQSLVIRKHEEKLRSLEMELDQLGVVAGLGNLLK
jgi:hypothetical protein